MARSVRLIGVLYLLSLLGSEAHAWKLAASFRTPDFWAVGPLKNNGPRFAIPADPGQIALHPAGKLLYVVSNVSAGDPPTPQDSELQVFDLTTRTEVTSFTLAAGESISDLVVLPSGAKAYASVGSTIAVIDLTTYAVSTIPLPFPASGGLAVDADGTHVVASGGGTADLNPFGRISVIDTATDTVANFVDLTLITGRIAIAPAGDRLYVHLYGTFAETSEIVVFDVATLSQVDTVTPALPTSTPYVTDLAMHSSGTVLYVSVVSVDPPIAGSVLIIDTGPATVRASIPNLVAHSLTTDPRGKTLWTARGTDPIGVYKIGCAVKTRRAIVMHGSVASIASRPCAGCRPGRPPCP